MSNVKGPDEAQNPDFEELVAQYQGSVLRMCFLYLCDKTLAEDAVQETFVKVYRGLNSFHGQSSIKTWIMKIAIHTCYDMNHSGWFRHFDRRITPEMLPEAAVPFEERDEELITAVMRLPIKLREVILLFYYQGFSISLRIYHKQVPAEKSKCTGASIQQNKCLDCWHSQCDR